MTQSIITAPEQLNLRARHPDFQNFLDFNEHHSKAVKEQYPCTLNLSYGDSSLQTLDVFPGKQACSQVLIFIHGGYWRGLDKSSYSFVAKAFVDNGFAVAIVNYRLLPKVTMSELHQDVFNAIHWVEKNITQYNGNPKAITLSGHSAGGQLALAAYCLEPSIRTNIKSICSLSGLFDLKPIQNSYLNDTLNLSCQDVEDFSLNNKALCALDCPTLLSVGGSETELFIEQSQRLYQNNVDHKMLQYLCLPELNHYQIAHQLYDENSEISRFILTHGV